MRSELRIPRCMRALRSPAACAVLVCALLLCPIGRAADVADHWNLGSLGATADLVDKRVVVQTVLADSPAEGKLEKGDVLLSAAGSPLTDRPFDVLGRVLDAAEKSGAIVLEIERSGAKAEVKLKLPKLGSYAGGFDPRNAKLKKHLKTACAYVASAQQSGGVWHKYQDGKTHRGDGITTATAMSALGLMAVDPKKYKTPIRSARGFVLTEVRPADLGPAATSGLHRNWPVAITSLFLAELYGQTGDKGVRKHAERMLDRLAQNQEPTGGWSHVPGFSEGPNYKSLSSLTALASISQAVALRVGLRPDPASVKKGLDYLEGCVAEDGAVAYSAVNGATGVQCAGRSCGALLAFHLHGRTGPRVDRLRAYVLAHHEDVLESHPAPLTGVLFAAMLAGCGRASGDAALEGFHDKLAGFLVPFATLARHPDGYFVAQPSDESRSVGRSQNKPNADREVHDPFWATAVLLMLHTTGKPRLVCLGGKARKR